MPNTSDLKNCYEVFKLSLKTGLPPEISAPSDLRFLTIFNNTYIGLFYVGTALLFVLLIGALAIAFSILVSMMPDLSMNAMKQQENIPPGWNDSPSSWPHRLPIIGLAFFSFFLARHMMAYQREHALMSGSRSSTFYWRCRAGRYAYANGDRYLVW